jgi:ATP-dependent Clp protease ATP-binding subunit ClpB
LRRLLQSTIEDQLAQRVLAGEVHEGDTVTFDADESRDGLVVLAPQATPV